MISVTFQDEKVNSRATGEYGWRVTPYAYLLLKARGPKVDKVPPLRLDLDFMDTSGYVVLPVESPTIPVDADAGQGVGAAVREASDHPDARRAAGHGRQADPRGQGDRPRSGARPGRASSSSITLGFRSKRSTIRASRSPVRSRTATRPDRLGAHLACLLPRRRGPAEASRDVPVRQSGQGRRSRDGLSALRGRRPGQGRARDLARGKVRPAAICLARLGRWGPSGARGCGGRDMENSLRVPSVWRSGGFICPRSSRPFPCSVSCAKSSTTTGSPARRTSWLARSSASSATFSRNRTAMRSTCARSRRRGYNGRLEVRCR